MKFTERQKFFIILGVKALLGAAAPITGGMAQAGGVIVPGWGLLIASVAFGVVAAATELLSLVKGTAA